MKELYFTETKSHLFLIFLMVCCISEINNYLLITLYTLIQIFRYNEHCQISCKNNQLVKLCTHFHLNSLFMCNFAQKTWFISNESAISRTTGFVWNEILCKKVISCKNTKLLRKRIFCFVETLIYESNRVFTMQRIRLISRTLFNYSSLFDKSYVRALLKVHLRLFKVLRRQSL